MRTPDGQTVFRKAHDKDNPYVIVDKTIFEEPTASWKAKGLMGYLLSRPNDWIVYMSDLQKRATDGAASVRGAVRELEKLGYLTRVRIRSEAGVFSGYEIGVHETPVPESERTWKPTKKELEKAKPNQVRLSTCGLPAGGLSTSGEPHTTNIDLTHNDLTNIAGEKTPPAPPVENPSEQEIATYSEQGSPAEIIRSISGEESNTTTINAESQQEPESMPVQNSECAAPRTVAQILGQPEPEDKPKVYGDPVAHGMAIARAREGITDLAHEDVIKAHCLISGLDFEQQPPGILKKWDTWITATKPKITRKPYISDEQFIARLQMLAKSPNALWLFKIGGPLAGGPYYPPEKMAAQLAAVGRQPEKGEKNANSTKQENGRELHEATRSLTIPEQVARACWRINNGFDARTGEKVPDMQFAATG